MKHNWYHFRNIEPSELNSIYHTPVVLYNARTTLAKQLEKYWFENIDRHIYNFKCVPVHSIIHFMNISYKEVSTPGWDAALSVKNKKAYICVDENQTLPIKRFMIAQMLAYLLLSDKTDDFEYSSWHTKYPTKLNQKYWFYAADLLVPLYLSNTLYKTLPKSAHIPFKRTIQSLYNKEIRVQNRKLKKEFSYIKLASSVLKVPDEVLTFVIRQKYRL